jgi:hemerythrin-like domain-containing protein
MNTFHDLVEQIKYDHISISRILFIMERELYRSDDLDYGLLADCMRYMVEYTDLVHHPKEDAVIDCISKKTTGFKKLTDEIKFQHESIGKLSIGFYDSIKKANLEESADAKEISETGLHYIYLQRKHIDLEEGRFLRDVRKFLLNDDYVQINRQYENYRDPQLSDDFESQYSYLYKTLVGNE